MTKCSFCTTGCLELARGSGSGTLEEDGKSGEWAVQGTDCPGRTGCIFSGYSARWQDEDLWAGGISLPGVQRKLRHASVCIVRRTSSCCGSHFSRFYSVCRTRSCAGAHRSSTSGKASYGVPAPTAFAAPAPVVEHISPDPTVYVAPAPVVECISPDLAEYAAAEYITPAPMEFAEAALHEIDEDMP